MGGTLTVGARPGALRWLEGFAGRPAAAALMAAWGFAEALLLPVVPDVGLGLLALAAPRRAVRLFAATVLGSLAGSLLLYGLSLAAPDGVRSLLLAVPGIGPPMLAAARDLVAGGDPLSLALFGPGTPLKVYTWAWTLGPGSLVGLIAGVLLNRLTRIGPLVVALALLGLVAPTWLRRHDRLVVAVYIAFWLVTYVSYWS